MTTIAKTSTTWTQSIGTSSFGLGRNSPTPAISPAPAPAPKAFDSALWQRLEAMSLDDPAAEKPISKRLAAENKWTVEETARAILEYKRFVYLTQRAGYEVTPSRPVDLVWHEHLMHTKHYWDTMCRDVLQNNLHHNPGGGGATDADRLRSQYESTLDSYREAFGMDPPADIWPRPANGKGNATRTILVLMTIIAIALGLAMGIWALAIVGLVGFVAALFAKPDSQRRNNGNNSATGGCGSGCGGGAIGSSGCGDSSSSCADGGGGDGGGSSCGGGGCGGGD